MRRNQFSKIAFEMGHVAHHARRQVGIALARHEENGLDLRVEGAVDGGYLELIVQVRDGAQTAYHHGDLRAALIDAGLQLTRSGGPEALTIREATRRAGVSANAAYRHFADREALLTAVAMAIQDRMAARMRGSKAEASREIPAP